MKKKSKSDLADFYYCAEQIFVSLVTFFLNPVVKHGNKSNSLILWRKYHSKYKELKGDATEQSKKSLQNLCETLFGSTILFEYDGYFHT